MTKAQRSKRKTSHLSQQTHERHRCPREGSDARNGPLPMRQSAEEEEDGPRRSDITEFEAVETILSNNNPLSGLQAGQLAAP